MINQSQSSDNHDASNSTKTAFVAGKYCLLSSLNSAWILDSGATDHICHDMSFFSNLSFTDPSNTSITIPNGSKVAVTLKGTITLGDTYFLPDVLYVPNFKFNLISIPKLCQDLNCQTIFSNNQCFIQDPLMRTQLLGNLQNGLYCLTESFIPKHADSHLPDISNTAISAPAIKSVSTKAKLWHLRMGHLPFHQLHHVHSDFENKTCIDDCFCQIVL
ncbi:Retrovirus-related Pol polyprotein from transposon RE2 [Bienertia sinuspersici]